jgi:type VII secretion protein EccB
MPNRRDQYHGYRFALRRQAGALLRADLDTADGPLRRLSSGVIASITVAVLAMAAAGLYGILSPSGRNGWQSGKTLIVDAQTGTRYVDLSGTLHPVLNYASALLILRSGSISASRVSDAAVNSLPHGAPVGIAGAPDTLPGPGSLLTGTWSVCSAPAIDAADAEHPLVRVALGAPQGGSTIPAGSGLLLRDVGGEVYLVWNNTKLHVPGGSSYVLTALGASATTPVPVGDALLNALPQGPDLAAPGISGLGTAGPAVPGLTGATTVGEVFQVSGTGAYYAALATGLAPVTQLQAQLLLVEQRQVAPVSLNAAQVQGAGSAALSSGGAAGLPPTVPKLATGEPDGTRVCVQPGDASQGTVTVTTQPATAQRLSATPLEPTDALGAPIADSVLIPPGKGALVRAVPQPGVTTGPLFLVTDAGVKYPIGNSSVLSDLGLNNVTPSQVGQPIMALIPTGPVLAENAALAQQAANPPEATAAATPTGQQ